MWFLVSVIQPPFAMLINLFGWLFVHVAIGSVMLAIVELIVLVALVAATSGYVHKHNKENV